MATAARPWCCARQFKVTCMGRRPSPTAALSPPPLRRLARCRGAPRAVAHTFPSLPPEEEVAAAVPAPEEHGDGWALALGYYKVGGSGWMRAGLPVQAAREAVGSPTYRPACRCCSCSAAGTRCPPLRWSFWGRGRGRARRCWRSNSSQVRRLVAGWRLPGHAPFPSWQSTAASSQELLPACLQCGSRALPAWRWRLPPAPSTSESGRQAAKGAGAGREPVQLLLTVGLPLAPSSSTCFVLNLLRLCACLCPCSCLCAAAATLTGASMQ